MHIAYQEVGEGPVHIVMINGTPSHLELQWENPSYAYLMDRMSRFGHLVTFDKRGSGLSDAASNQPTLEERMDDVRAVMDAVGLERAVIFGQSEGSPMAMLFAATYPHRTTMLVLYGSIVRWVGRDFHGAVDPDEFTRHLDDVVDHWGEGHLADWLAPTFAGGPFAELVHEGFGAFERGSMSPGAFRDLMRLNAQIDVRDVVPAINVPTLVLHRRDDSYISVEQSRWLAATVDGARYRELDGADHALVFGDVDPVIDEIEEFVTGTRHSPPADRVLATVLFTDIVGSTELATRLGDAQWKQVLDRQMSATEEVVTRYGGRMDNTTGDGMLATFDGPGRAVEAAAAATRAAARSGIGIRVGLHAGEIELRGDDIAGIAVHVAARIMALAPAGGVYTSRTVRDLVVGSGLQFTDCGVHHLKGVDDEWQLFSVNA